MTIVASTFHMELTSLEGVSLPMQWDNRESRIKASILFGIEQARLNLGRSVTDADLATDDDE